MLKFSAKLKKVKADIWHQKRPSCGTNIVDQFLWSYRFLDKGRTIVPSVTCPPLAVIKNFVLLNLQQSIKHKNFIFLSSNCTFIILLLCAGRKFADILVTCHCIAEDLVSKKIGNVEIIGPPPQRIYNFS